MTKQSPISSKPCEIAVSIHSLLDTAERLIQAGEVDLGIQTYLAAADRLNDAADALSFLAVVQHCERVMRECILPALDAVLPLPEEMH